VFTAAKKTSLLNAYSRKTDEVVEPLTRLLSFVSVLVPGLYE
jgi:hypothetical protein